VATQPHPLAASAGIGISASLLGATLIPAGGLASLALAAGIACAGAATATWLWKHPGPEDPVAASTVDAATLVLLAALLGPVAAVRPLHGLTVLGGWLAMALMARHAVVLVGGAWAMGIALAVLLAAPHPIETALLPVPAAAGAALPHIVTLGALLSGLGTAGWSQLRRVPGDRGTPWVGVGMGILALLAVGVATAGRYGATLGAHAELPGGLFLTLCAAGLASWSATRPDVRRGALVGALATAWVAGATALGAASLQSTTAWSLVPALAAVPLLRRARSAGGASRWVLAGWSLALAASAVASFSWPGTVADAVGLGGLVVGSFWSVMVRQPTPLPETAR